MDRKSRIKKLKRNQKLLFWAQALINVKIINSVAVLFYIHRGLTLQEIFFLSIVWSVMILALEIPSSYLADRWGRKKTLILGYISLLINSVIIFQASSLTAFIIAFVFFAASFAMLSGTDEAMVYDTDKELKNNHSSLKTLTRYYASQRVLKMFTPIIAVLIAKDLLEWQFQMIIGIDFVSIFLAFILILLTIEPKRSMSVIEEEAGIIKGAFHAVATNKSMRAVMFNKVLMVISLFILWRYYQDLFYNLGVSVIELGITFSILQAFIFFTKMYMSKKQRGIRQIQNLIFRLNIATFTFLLLLLVGITLEFHYILLLICFVLAMALETIRWPLFSEIFNKHFKSYNRATSLSMTNVLKSVVDIPLLFIVMLYINQSNIYPILISLIIILFVLAMYPIRKVKFSKNI